jgi:hypothetical protein
MVKLRSVLRAAVTATICARVHFCGDRSDLANEHRMLLIHAEAQASARNSSIPSAWTAPRAVHTHGLRLGRARRRFARIRAQNPSDIEAFMTGPQLHTLALSGSRRSGWKWMRRRQVLRRALGTTPRAMAPALLRCSYRSGCADPDRLRLWLHSAFKGRPILYKRSRMRRMGTTTAASSQARRGVGRRERVQAFPSIANRSPTSSDLQTQVGATPSWRKRKLLGGHAGDSPSFRAAYELFSNRRQTTASPYCCSAKRGRQGNACARAARHGTGRNAPFIAINCAAIPHDLRNRSCSAREKAPTPARSSAPGPLRARGRRHRCFWMRLAIRPRPRASC